jgi:hypothetical protein
VKLHGATFDVVLEGSQFEVRTHGKSMRAPVGRTILLHTGELTISEKSLPGVL